MSETNPMNDVDPVPAPATSFYRVPKWLVWGLTALAVTLLLRQYLDLWSHINWPPWDGSNQEFRKSLKCELKPSMSVTKEMLRGQPSNERSEHIGLDRRAFFEKPECVAASMYLYFEGSGVRDEFDVYDMVNKRKTARVVITHEKFYQKAATPE